MQAYRLGVLNGILKFLNQWCGRVEWGEKGRDLIKLPVWIRAFNAKLLCMIMTVYQNFIQVKEAL